MVVVNSGAIRETDADEACRSADPIGPYNAAWIEALIPTCALHIAGWGPNASRFGGDEIVLHLFRDVDVMLHALAINRDGSPKHPLYVSYDTKPVPLPGLI